MKETPSLKNESSDNLPHHHKQINEIEQSLLPSSTVGKSSQPRVLFFLHVKEGVTRWNIIAMTLILFTMLQILLFYEVSFVYLLQAEDYFNLSTQEASIVSNDIIFWTQLMSLVFDLLFGSCHDLFGRKLTIVIGFMIASIAMALQPLLTSPYPGLIILRLVMLASLSGPASHPLVADYVKQKSRGTASAYVGLMAGMGVLFGMFVMFGSTKNYSYVVSYSVSSSFTFLIALFLFFTIKNARYEKKQVQQMDLGERIKVKSAQIVVELRDKVEFSVCLIGGMLCKMLNLISTVFINLWLSSFYSRDTEGQL